MPPWPRKRTIRNRSASSSPEAKAPPEGGIGRMTTVRSSPPATGPLTVVGSDEGSEDGGGLATRTPCTAGDDHLADAFSRETRAIVLPVQGRRCRCRRLPELAAIRPDRRARPGPCP